MATQNPPPRWRPAGSDSSAAESCQQLHRIDRPLFELLQGTLLRRLIGPPAQDRGAVTKAFTGEMIVGDLDHELRLQRTPLCRAFGRPAARAAWCVAGKAFLGDQRHELRGQRRLLVFLDCRGEADMVQQPLVVIAAEQQRAYPLFAVVAFIGSVAEAADDAVGAAEVLDLLHALAIAGLI